MPVFRGIEISIATGAESGNVAEYPHPDASSVRLLPADDGHLGGCLRQSDSSLFLENDPTRQKKINPRVSVYVPSIPGEQFWIKYRVHRLPPSTVYLYFKLFMNGRLITSWGISAAKNTGQEDASQLISGTVSRALYEANEKWHDEATDTELETLGIESRCFHFMPGQEKRSVAEDGGLIEVLVFRSNGRRRCAPKMTEFRNQEKYGIASASRGLIDTPEDATFYDWLLVDPKDSPYAMFRFHYRSLNYLHYLNLIPQSESSTSLTPLFRIDSSSEASSASSPKELTRANDSPGLPQFTFKCGVAGLNPIILHGRENGRENDLNQYNETTEKTAAHPSRKRYFLRNPLKGPCSAPTNFDPQTLLRPLPELPTDETRSVSRLSTQSNCPSLTPSLAHYVNNDNFSDEDVSLEMAQTAIPSVPSMVEITKSDVGDEDSASDYENSSQSSVGSQRLEYPSPTAYRSMTGSVLMRHLADYSPTITRPVSGRARQRLSLSASQNSVGTQNAHGDSDNSAISESQWMRSWRSDRRKE